MERWSPDLEEGYKQGMKAGMEMHEDSKGWTVIGLIGAGLSGFIVGVIVGVAFTLIVIR